ncbi:metal ABC transporter ATP-binding protein [Rathayibacter sp. YIM 133350]|uniref:metal ABC transporter ATP-binding protein n=1 Tax=Rathayibacter sp. YIM 133350 TaxID=3131992 RepID=UPI00307EDBAE
MSGASIRSSRGGANPTTDAVLRLENAAFSYNGTAAVHGVSLEMAAGEAVALIGPNGSGKSTLLKGVLGLIPVTAGRFESFGQVRSGLPAARAAAAARAARRRIGYLPQSDELDPDFPLTLQQVVTMGRYRSLGYFRWPGRADTDAVRRSLEAVGLADRAATRFGDLSGGQQQRGLLARALASGPGLLLLDEPFNGLDQANRDALVQTLRVLKERGVAVMVSTHDLELAREVCDTVLLMNGGQVACGPTTRVLTLDNVQAAFGGVGVEVDEHTLVVPGHEGH